MSDHFVPPPRGGLLGQWDQFVGPGATRGENLVTLSSAALGLLVAGFLEYRDSSFRTEEELRRLLSLPVVALIPNVSSEGDIKDERRRALAGRIAAILVFVLGSAAALIFWRGLL